MSTRSRVFDRDGQRQGLELLKQGAGVSDIYVDSDLRHNGGFSLRPISAVRKRTHDARSEGQGVSCVGIGAGTHNDAFLRDERTYMQGLRTFLSGLTVPALSQDGAT